MTEFVLREILSAKNGKIASLTLQRPQALNALNLAMIESVHSALKEWQENPQIRAIILQSNSERAFCSGGDVRVLGENILQSKTNINAAAQYFRNEFFLDYYIHHYPKPILCWGDGIVMGGGIGLLAGCSHRVVTLRSLLAMPEITIGYFPDVGSTWFLNKMPNPIGLFLGITGARFSGADALYNGLANYLIAPDKKNEIFQSLLELNWANSAAENSQILSLALTQNSIPLKLATESSTLQHQQGFFQALEKITDFTEFYKFLLLAPDSDPWVNSWKPLLRGGSPTSIRVIFAQLTRGKRLPMLEAFAQEWVLATNFALRPDFSEGIRAALIDKDKRPHWRPNSVDLVSDAEVEKFFDMPPGFSHNPLLEDLLGLEKS